MDQRDVSKIKRNLPYLMKGLTVDEEFVAHLEADGILNTTMVEKIQAKSGMSERVSQLSLILPRRGPRAFEGFLRACINTDQAWIAETLDPKLAIKCQNQLSEETVVDYPVNETTHTEDKVDYGHTDLNENHSHEFNNMETTATNGVTPNSASAPTSIPTPLVPESDPNESRSRMTEQSTFTDKESETSTSQNSGDADEEKELTDVRLFKLSNRLPEEDLYTLGIEGLGIRDYVILRHLTNCPNRISIAVYMTLREWRRGQKDSIIAHKMLCEGLRKVKMSFYINEALQ